MGGVDASFSYVWGQGLTSGMAGEEFSFFLQARDKHLPEIQALKLSSNVNEHTSEIQSIEVKTENGNYFSLSFRGKSTENIFVGSATLHDLKDTLEALHTLTHSAHFRQICKRVAALA